MVASSPPMGGNHLWPSSFENFGTLPQAMNFFSFGPPLDSRVNASFSTVPAAINGFFYQLRSSECIPPLIGATAATRLVAPGCRHLGQDATGDACTHLKTILPLARWTRCCRFEYIPSGLLKASFRRALGKADESLSAYALSWVKQIFIVSQ